MCPFSKELPKTEFFALRPQEAAGAVAHRIQDLQTEHGGHKVSMYSCATYITFSTDTLYDYAKGGKNTNLLYQSCTLMG